jgi:hypothetical protein
MIGRGGGLLPTYRARRSPRRRVRKAPRRDDAERLYLRQTLPYGAWSEKDGSIVLFNRNYEPLWRRSPDGTTTKVTGAISHRGVVWIDWTKQEHFFHDGCTPWHNVKTRELCESILRWFDVPGGAS